MSEYSNAIKEDYEIPEDLGATPARLSMNSTPVHLMREISMGLGNSSVRSRRQTDGHGDLSDDDNLL